MNTEEKTLEQRSLEFATVAHQGQKRKYTGEDYIVHPIAIANKLKSLGFHETMVSAAYLHDTVEDTCVSIHDIEVEFGITIARMVADLTDVYTHEAYPKIARKERKILEAYRLWNISGQSKSIKLADIIDNTPSIMDNDKNFGKIYLQEKEELLKVLEGGDIRLMNEATELLIKYKKLIL